jgi:hypothetical protein
MFMPAAAALLAKMPQIAVFMSGATGHRALRKSSAFGSV